MVARVQQEVLRFGRSQPDKQNKQPSFIDRYAWIGLVLVLSSRGTIKPKWRRVRDLLVGQKSDIRNFLHKQKVQTWGRHHMGWHLVFRRLWWSSQFHHIAGSATPMCKLCNCHDLESQLRIEYDSQVMSMEECN
jgi:hypothetical protein